MWKRSITDFKRGNSYSWIIYLSILIVNSPENVVSIMSKLFASNLLNCFGRKKPNKQINCVGEKSPIAQQLNNQSIYVDSKDPLTEGVSVEVDDVNHSWDHFDFVHTSQRSRLAP